MNRMQRIERDEIRRQRSNRPIDEIAKIAKVSATPVAPGTQSVERDCLNPRVAPRGLPRTIRRDDEARAIRVPDVRIS